DGRSRRRKIGHVARVEGRDRGPEPEPLGAERERPTEAERVAEARTVGAREALRLELARNVERSPAAAGNRGERDGGKSRHRTQIAVSPPSIASSAPVMKRDSSEAR